MKQARKVLRYSQAKTMPGVMVASERKGRYVRYSDFKRFTASLAEKDREIERLKALCARAMDILNYHGSRCDMDPLNNFGGSEEHLAEYRQVILDIAKEVNLCP